MLLPLATFPAADPDDLYQAGLGINWSEQLSPDGSLAVHCTLIDSKITHSRFAALRIKDAIVDQFRSRYDRRPSVSLEQPDLSLNLHVHRDQATLSLDLSGASLHRRGYRIDGVHAPLKENLAAAILIRAGWPAICAAGGGLVDPMCGSGTLPLEAALLATDTAPGLLRDYYGFNRWLGHDGALWDELLDEARQRAARPDWPPRLRP